MPIISDGIQYYLPETILKTFGNSITKQQAIQQTITNIQHQTYNVLPHSYNNNYFNEKINNKFNQNKNIILDFITDIKTNSNSDFYLTNWHNSFNCTECNIPINKSEKCFILKCCNLPYHTTCLMNKYTLYNQNNTKSIKCNKCGICKNDITGKNYYILTETTTQT
jgi:hypothetical protein